MNAGIIAFFSLAIIGTFLAFDGAEAGLLCDRTAVTNAANSNQCFGHPRAYDCGDGTKCQCVAALFRFCGAGYTGSWRQGRRVIDNCYSIPKFTAIATFNGGRYDGHAGIFSHCTGSGNIQMYDQWCGQPFKLRSKNGAAYYVVE